MVEHTLIDWIGTTLLMVFGVTMMVQGHFIVTGKYGYKHTEREKQKLKDVRKQVEQALNKDE